MSGPPISGASPSRGALPRSRRLRILARLLRAARGRRERGTRPALHAGHLPPVQGRLEVVRDARGVPHVFAEVERDAHAALGFLQAADRFFLLDVLRHVGAGRLTGWLGNWRAPERGEEIFSGRSVLDLDAFLRPFGFEDASRRDWEAMTGPARDNVAAFAEGVNAALRAMHGVYPPEYLFLPRPRPWHASDCLLAARASGFFVSLINLENELTFDAVRGHAGDDLARRLYPEAPWEQAPVVDRHGEGTLPEPPMHLPSAGSNNWAVAAWRSASGAPLVANDPHVPLVPLPTYWYHAHLECPEYRVQGGCFPGYPAFGFGHNGHLAWGCTTAFRDAWDLYRVHRLPGDPARYRVPAGSGEIRRHRESHAVRFRRPAELAWESCEHGILYPGWRHDDGADLAVRYVPSDAARYLAGYRGLAAARDVAAHRAALAEIHQGPFDFNHVYAHKDGHVGWEVFGRLPRRRRDGLFVRDAHDPEAQWDGFLGFEEMPRRLAPASGFVASANSSVDPAQAARVATLSHYEPRLRQERIESVLRESKTHRPEDSMALQADVTAPYAPPLRDVLLALLDRHAGAPTREGEALALLRAWDGGFAAESAGAAIFFFTLRSLAELVFVALLGGRLGRRFANGRRARPRLHRLLLDPGDPLRGDVERAAGRSLADLADEAFRAALDRVASICGAEPETWAWGRIQRARLGSVLAEIPRLGRRLVALDVPFPGDDYTVNPSRSLDEGHRLRAFVGASSRFVCDLARPEEAFFAHSSGPSGDPASAWHGNLCAAWSRFEYFRSALWSPDRVPDPVERLVVEAGDRTRASGAGHDPV
jgi:penicillin amidase